MAMNSGRTPNPEHRDARDRFPAPDMDTSIVDQAASALRSYTDHGWSSASRRILGQVLTATRRSRPIRAHTPDGSLFHVTDQVVTTYLQATIDNISGAEATHIGFVLKDTQLVAIGVGIAVDYPEHIAPLARAVREAVRTTVDDVLGTTPAPDPARIDVHVRDVHPPP